MEHPDDQELISRIQNGDVRSYELLVKKYQQKIFTFVNRYVFDDETSKEITQDVLFRVYTIIDRIDLRKKFSSYVYEMAKNKAIDYLRTQRKTVDLDEDLAEDMTPLEELLFEEDRNHLIHEAIKKLSKNYQQVILLYYFDELSYEEISKRLEVPINTVRTHLRRAKKELEKLL